MKNLLSFLFALLIVGCVVSCKKTNDSKGAQQTQTEDDTMVRSKADTLQIIDITQRYLNFLKENNFDEAFEMLYEFDEENFQVAPATEETKAMVKEQVTTFPIINYHIDKVVLITESESEVHFTTEWFEKAPDNPMQNTLQQVLCPVRVGINWYLTLPKLHRTLIPEGQPTE